MNPMRLLAFEQKILQTRSDGPLLQAPMRLAQGGRGDPRDIIRQQRGDDV